MTYNNDLEVNIMLLDKFLRYVRIDTQSDEESTLTPSTSKQYDLLNLLKKELEELGVKAELDKYGRLYARIRGNKDYPYIGLCAHVDTALECSGKDVNPQVIEKYDLSDIHLGFSGLYLSPKEFPKLKECRNKTLITTDGTTLLGADDKAGVAIIMEVLERYLKIDENKRRGLSILFTPDEEIGRGPEHFDPIKYGCAFAYTIDGSDPKDIEIENFNAKAIEVDIVGKSIHPGDAKGVMINASLVLADFMNMLPKNMTPANTSKREGFNHVTSIEGNVEHAVAHYILRNHDAKILNKQVEDFESIKDRLLEAYPGVKITLKVKDQYRNMIEVINERPDCKKHIEKVYARLGIKYEYNPIRGGTDGATFSFKGVPCPNLGTGSYNHHGRYEFAVLEEMEQMVKIGLEIFKL